MTYRMALEAAGATIHAFEEFGSYQGDWIARLTHDGEDFYVAGAYGSCSGCDAFENEFGFIEQACDIHWMEAQDSCVDCRVSRDDFQASLVEFGQKYLADPRSRDELMVSFQLDLDWDYESKQVVDWLRAQPW